MKKSKPGSPMRTKKPAQRDAKKDAASGSKNKPRPQTVRFPHF